jgi:hypothetical protein
MSERFSLLTPLGLGLVVTTLAAGYAGCKKDEPPPPLPSAAPAPTPTPTEQLTLVPEDAGAVDAGDDADAGKRTGTGTSMASCCNALASNANLAPSPNKEILLTAAGICKGAVGAGQGNAQVLAAVQGALRGIGMPAACK